MLRANCLLPSASCLLFPADDAARALAPRERVERVVDVCEGVGACGEFGEFETAFAVEFDEARHVSRGLPRAVERADEALLLHDEGEERERGECVEAREPGQDDGAALARQL